MTNSVTQPEYLDLKGLSAYASLPVPTLRDYMKSCGLPCFKVRGKLLVKRSEFDAWIEGFRVSQNRLGKIVSEVMKSLKSDEHSEGPRG
jgi:hypothetical protein